MTNNLDIIQDKNDRSANFTNETFYILVLHKLFTLNTYFTDDQISTLSFIAAKLAEERNDKNDQLWNIINDIINHYYIQIDSRFKVIIEMYDTTIQSNSGGNKKIKYHKVNKKHKFNKISKGLEFTIKNF